MKTLQYLISLLFFLHQAGMLMAQSNGSSCANALSLYPAGTGDCSNSSGAQYAGQYQCEYGDCANNAMPASGGGVDGSCTSDNDASQQGIWLTFTATSNNITITNMTDYSGPGAADIEKKDYVIFSGSCGSLTQIGCAANVANGSSTTVSGLTAGQTYYIWVTRSSQSLAAGCATCNLAATCLTSTVAFVPSGETCASAVSLTTNVTLASTNANSVANGPICSGSVENDVWYQWCAPASWPAGQQAYISVYDQICNSTSGLQLTVWNTNTTCPTAATDPDIVCQNPGSLTQYYYQWTAVANTCYYIVLDGYAGTACSYNITVGSIIVLLQNEFFLRAIPEDRGVMLNWNFNTSGTFIQFEVQKSHDGNLFYPISRFEHNAETNFSSYLDEHFENELSYYRILATTSNGENIYSYTVVVNPDFSTDSPLLVYPNPVNKNEIITIYAQLGGRDSDPVLVEYFDISGVLKKSVLQNSSGNSIILPADVSSGMYFIKCTRAGHTAFTRVVVK
jgi:hypothetical protein